MIRNNRTNNRFLCAACSLNKRIEKSIMISSLSRYVFHRRNLNVVHVNHGYYLHDFWFGFINLISDGQTNRFLIRYGCSMNERFQIRATSVQRMVSIERHIWETEKGKKNINNGRVLFICLCSYFFTILFFSVDYHHPFSSSFLLASLSYFHIYLVLVNGMKQWKQVLEMMMIIIITLIFHDISFKWYNCIFFIYFFLSRRFFFPERHFHLHASGVELL